MDELENSREAAVKRLKAKRDFKTHVATYLFVNTMLVVIWAVADGGYFWPIWPILGWGIGLVLDGWRVYFQRPITEDEIRREMERGT